MFIEPEDMPRAHVVFKKDGETRIRKTFEKAYNTAIKDGPKQTEIIFSLDHASQILFCERALIAEGQTERRLLPALYKQYFDRTMGMDRFALVIVDGKDSINKTKLIMDEMGINAKILMDFDAVFTKEHFCNSSDSDRQECEKYLKSNGLKGAAGCVQMCGDTKMETHVNALCDKLQKKGIWAWSKGDIEAHLGIQPGQKSPYDHAAFKGRLDENGMSAVFDQSEIENFLNWLVS